MKNETNLMLLVDSETGERIGLFDIKNHDYNTLTRQVEDIQEEEQRNRSDVEIMLEDFGVEEYPFIEWRN